MNCLISTKIYTMNKIKYNSETKSFADSNQRQVIVVGLRYKPFKEKINASSFSDAIKQITEKYPGVTKCKAWLQESTAVDSYKEEMTNFCKAKSKDDKLIHFL